MNVSSTALSPPYLLLVLIYNIANRGLIRLTPNGAGVEAGIIALILATFSVILIRRVSINL